jgi:GAF domain-containing protein
MGSLTNLDREQDRSQSLIDTLATYCKLAEQRIPGAIAGYTPADPTGMLIKQAVFPNLPRSFQGAIKAIPLAIPYTGTCAQAICTGIAVASDDITVDARFDTGWRRLCLDNGIKSLRSKPIRVDPCEGTFVIGFKHATTPDDWDDALMTEFADLAAEAIKRHKSHEVVGYLAAEQMKRPDLR